MQNQGLNDSTEVKFHFTLGGHTCERDTHCWAAVLAWHGLPGSTEGLWGTPCCWSLWSNSLHLLRRTAAVARGHACKRREVSRFTPGHPHHYNVKHASHLTARTATRMHRNGSSSVLAPAASSISAQVTSPLEIAKYKGVFLRSP